MTWDRRAGAPRSALAPCCCTACLQAAHKAGAHQGTRTFSSGRMVGSTPPNCRIVRLLYVRCFFSILAPKDPRPPPRRPALRNRDDQLLGREVLLFSSRVRGSISSKGDAMFELTFGGMNMFVRGDAESKCAPVPAARAVPSCACRERAATRRCVGSVSFAGHARRTRLPRYARCCMRAADAPWCVSATPTALWATTRTCSTHGLARRAAPRARR